MAPPSLAPGQPLGPEWTVEAFAPGERVVLRKDTSGDWGRARSAAIVGLGSLATAVALAAATPEGLALVTWPVAGLLAVVALMALPAAVRSGRRGRLGVTLEATREGVAGWPVPKGALHDVRAGPRRASAADVSAVTVRQAPHPPLVLWMLELTLRDGVTLAGPEVATPEGQPSPLEPAADALRRVLEPKGH
jgi:hypothetical protein